jgi:hypothetical protein
MEKHDLSKQSWLCELEEAIGRRIMGFFVITGQRYQMVIPAQLNINVVKKAALMVAHNANCLGSSG